MLWEALALMNILLGGTRRASTLTSLARKIGVDPAGLTAKVNECNVLATSSGGRPARQVSRAHHATRLRTVLGCQSELREPVRTRPGDYEGRVTRG